MAVEILRKKFTVGQYHQMVESGILTDRDRVELLQGDIIEMSPVASRHAACVDRLNEVLVLGLSARAMVRVQGSIHLGHRSAPQPDVAILRRRPDFYATAHPQADDVLALVEVADTTVEFDRTVKVPLYAQDGIAEVWMVDLKADAVEVYRGPRSDGYQQVQTFQRGDGLEFQALADAKFTVDQILG
jgi:Uma2 family endonuclease